MTGLWNQLRPAPSPPTLPKRSLKRAGGSIPERQSAGAMISSCDRELDNLSEKLFCCSSRTALGRTIEYLPHRGRGTVCSYRPSAPAYFPDYSMPSYFRSVLAINSFYTVFFFRSCSFSSRQHRHRNFFQDACAAWSTSYIGPEYTTNNICVQGGIQCSASSKLVSKSMPDLTLVHGSPLPGLFLALDFLVHAVSSTQRHRAHVIAR